MGKRREKGRFLAKSEKRFRQIRTATREEPRSLRQYPPDDEIL